MGEKVAVLEKVRPASEENKAVSRRMTRAICEAMLALLGEKPFGKITVQDILQKAEIHRSTFYRYFRDKYEVVETINHQIVETLVPHFFAVFYGDTQPDWELVTSFVATYRKALPTLMRLEVEGVHLVRYLGESFRQVFTGHYPGCTECEVFMAGQGFVSILFWVLENGTTGEYMTKERMLEAYTRNFARFAGLNCNRLVEYVHQNRKK